MTVKVNDGVCGFSPFLCGKDEGKEGKNVLKRGRRNEEQKREESPCLW